MSLNAPAPIRRRRTLAGGALVLAALAATAVPLTVSGGWAPPPPAYYSAGAAREGLHVLPFPGTPDASRTTEIVFSSLRPDEIRSVTVIGLRSGVHRGRLTALPFDRGTAFIPNSRFTRGEQVSVKASLSSPASGTASGAPGATSLSFCFAIASRITEPDGPAKTPLASTSSSSQQTRTQNYHSAPDLRPPTVTASSDPDSAEGEIFLTPSNGSQVGPMILDGAGQLVWFDPLHGKAAFDLEVQRYRGKPVLTWWQGKVLNGHGVHGEDVIRDSSYRTVAIVHAGEGYSPDLHDFTITPQGTALVTAYSPVSANLSSVGGPADGGVLDSIVQEVDIKTGQVLWEWHALGHVPLSASYTSVGSGNAPYDYFHINSIQQLPDGNLLISARNTWAIYEISRATGNVIWELGGKYSSFKMGSGTNFEWQHDARLAFNGTLTLFDDGATPNEERESSGKQLALDTGAMTTSLLHRYTHTPPVLAGSQGNLQKLPDGDVFIGWGAEPEFSEYDPSGRQTFSGSFTLPLKSYRAFRFDWSAIPVQRPSVAVVRGGGTDTVYASWNGATGVRRWQLLAGSGPDKLSPVKTVRATGFETAIPTPGSPRYIAVRALGAGGGVLGTSATRAS